MSAIANAIARDAKARAKILARTKLAELTAREREVLSHLLRGGRNKDTAEALGIGVKTVKVHRRRLMRKLEMRSVAELVQFAIEAAVNSVPMPPHSGHCGRRTGRRNGSRIQGASRSDGRFSESSPADFEKRLMAAGIHELHALLFREAGGRELIQADLAMQFASALAPSARAILEGERIDIGTALKALDHLEQMLGPSSLQKFRHTVTRQ